MCPVNGNSTNLLNQHPGYLAIGVEENHEMIISTTKKNIEELSNISLRIRYYTDYINRYWDSNEQKYQHKVILYLNYLGELYRTLPTFVKNEEEINASNCYVTIIQCALAPVILLVGLVIRVAQRSFSIEVVSNTDIIGKTFFESIRILGLKMYDALLIPQNYAVAGVDILSTYALSYYPFGLKNLVNLFSATQSDEEVLKKYLPLEVTIKKLKKHLVREEYNQLNAINSKIDKIGNDLKAIIAKHDLIKHFKDELTDTDFTDDLSLAQFNEWINLWTNNNSLDNILSEINELLATDVKDEDYSLHKILKNSWNNIKVFLITLGINHLVITASSSYTAQSLTWEGYKQDIFSPNNIISTVGRATVMKFVNEYFIKNALNIMFSPIKNYFCANYNDTLIELFKKKVNNQNKPTQIGIYIVSFIFTTIVTNAIKTYAADVTQNQGDWKKAWAQFQETFPKWGMVLSALGVTSSDLYNLTTKMKPVLKLIYKEKEEQKIIDEVLSQLPNMINTVNGNGVNHEHDGTIIRRENGASNGVQLSGEIVHEINDSDIESLVNQPNNRSHSNKFCIIM